MNRKQSDKKLSKPELLAPAGDLARAKVAINYGADAVYLGGMSFSLRSHASNFTMDDIREICAYAKEHGANIHVTVNIMPHNEDFEGLEEYLKELDTKLNEEVAEYQADKSIEEMADVLEVLFAICEARGHSVEELLQVREDKREKRGGFKDKIYLVENE
jgi:predicted house-cleaning noncanonical NTP pyrophosphatase (MazG superfamily)